MWPAARHVPLRPRRPAPPTCTASPCRSSCSSSPAALVNSPFGLSLRGIREKRAAHAGARRPGAARLVARLHLGAAIAGVAGALLAQTTQFVGLDVLGFERSAELLIMLVLGGTGRLYGAFIGAACS